MRTLGQLVICVLLVGPSAHAAFGPWDLELDGAARFAHAVERHVAVQSDRLGVYLSVPSAELRAIAELPLVRELAHSLRLWEVGRLLASQAQSPAKVTRPCRSRG